MKKQAARLGKNSPIRHVVVLMLENRSFDHIFGYRPGVNGLSGKEFNLPRPSQPESESNPAYYVSNGAPFAVPVGQGPGHSFNAANEQLAANKNGPSARYPAKSNGWVMSYQSELRFADRVRNATAADIRVVMEAFTPSRLPSIEALADHFVLCDNWYSEVPGPTQPNRLYMHAATSAGYVHNVWSREFDFRTIYNNLQDAGRTWATYSFDLNEAAHFTQLRGESARMKNFADSFAADVKSGALPDYSFLVPQFMNSATAMANSQHAPQDARYGDNLIADVYGALRANAGVWNQSVLIVTYDEHGGFYDHVVPPAMGIPNPDGIQSPPPGDTASWVPKFAFDRLGFRVPALIVSPWVSSGNVDSTRYQHTSILATLKNLFGLPEFLTKRDASATPFDGLFQELNKARTDTPEELPRAALPAAPPKDSAEHPANQPLDPTQKEILVGVHHLTRTHYPGGLSAETMPTTQGEAHRYVRDAYRRLHRPARR